jgi:Transcriptional regulator
MELRVLQYFLAVTREQSISGAAEALHLSQPTLSRQLKDMEEELGKQLMIRGNRKITLTEEGMILRKRAEEILDLVQKAEHEITISDDVIAGDVYIGAGETDAVRLLAKAGKKVQMEYPNIHYHISSGDTTDVLENLDKGLIDFGMIFGPIDTSKYEYLEFPVRDEYGILMRKDSPLANRDVIRPEDLQDKPIIFNRNTRDGDLLTSWLGKSLSELNVAATYNLLFNASLMVDEGLGYAFALNKIINTTGNGNLCFIPCEPTLSIGMSLIWKKYQVFPKAAKKFLEEFQKLLDKN